jgi:hypothetical protein
MSLPISTGPRAILFAAMLAASLSARGADRVWFIGGGYDPDSSQAQIEANVAWASGVVRALPGGREVRVYFTDGANVAADVKEYPPPPGSGSEPLARLHDLEDIGGYHYRNHRIADVAGGTARDVLVPYLERGLAALDPGDSALIVFNGHGTPGRFNDADNRLWLWNSTSLSAREFEQLLSHARPGTRVRFVLTQCFSGAFARAVHPQARSTLELSSGERCGFLAEAADQPAEGCSAAVDSSDYRDYTTYFFAALGGRTRAGADLPLNPDRDGDGTVSPFEAHLYALRAAVSTDVPRSTSEDFLERWQPWWPDWRAALGLVTPAHNLYTDLADEIAADAGLAGEGRELTRAVRRERGARRTEHRRVVREIRALERRAGVLQEVLRAGLASRWPQLARAGRAAARQRGAQVIQAEEWLRAQVDYRELVEAQSSYTRLTQAALDGERRLTRLDKIERLQRLGRWLARFEREAGPDERAAYERLAACERAGL